MSQLLLPIRAPAEMKRWLAEKRQWLPKDFLPSEYHVLVGRGKLCYRHLGNQQVVQIVQSFLPEYNAKDSSKKTKSLLIRKIVALVRERGASKDADFVKYDNDSERWYIVEERTAREKVSQSKSYLKLVQ